MVTIIDYGVGNLFSLKSSFAALGVDVQVTSEKSAILNASKIILPGVGAFEDASKKLHDSGLDEVLKTCAKKGTPIMGICLGMQMLFDKSYENGCFEGLGLIKGEVRAISEVIPKDLKIPQIGWNALDIKKESPIFKYIKDGDYVYFVHSYYATNCDESIIATTSYGAPLTAAVQYKNVYGCQFHPEKSGDVGLKILKAFVEV